MRHRMCSNTKKSVAECCFCSDESTYTVLSNVTGNAFLVGL